MYRFDHLKHLFTVIPGSIAGEYFDVMDEGSNGYWKCWLHRNTVKIGIALLIRLE
ncbi:hypothetical protein NXW37_29540 [Bacteroides thetaiotaomicron]|nr:hypothetical protein [Bacteroides thetaiotaomicron]